MLAILSMVQLVGGSGLLHEEAVCSTSQGVHANAVQLPFTACRANLGTHLRHSRSRQRRCALTARADARSQDFQRGGLDFHRAAKLRLDQLVNRVQGCVVFVIATLYTRH